MNYGILYLIPAPLSDNQGLSVTPAGNLDILRRLRYFITEDSKTARSYLHLCGVDLKSGIDLSEYNEHSDLFDVQPFLEPLKRGFDCGILSEAGLPCVADPGALIVAEAHRQNIKVVPLPGPSSLFMALMASGFNGQQFHFHGYLPVEKDQRIRRLKEIDRQLRQDKYTHIFIETPYRNLQLFESILKTCQSSTLLCVASGITDRSELIKTHSISEWKKKTPPSIHKIPCVFLLFTENPIK